MSKILIYVDAENVSQSQVSASLIEAKSIATKEDIIIGKFYGVKETLGSLIEDYVDLGFEYVDTSVYTDNHKNTTDMKLITDCLWEVVSVYQGDIKAIYILSNDRDFNPLVAKLKGFNFILNVASASVFGDLASTEGLVRVLQIRKFLPVKKEVLSECIYDSIAECVRDLDIADIVIVEYLRERINKLKFTLKKKYNVELPEVTIDYIKKFNFRQYNNVMLENNFNDLEENITLFTSKMFGVILSRKEILEVHTLNSNN